jgi:RNA polymerase sigma factor (sigma-70 family)
MEDWLSTLDAGQSQEAWNLFIARYRALIVATIRRTIRDRDELMDLFAIVCEALSANDFARLRRYSAASPQRATVATWLVIVVRNLTVDWLRREHGRPRVAVPDSLSPLQREIFGAICVDGASHVEAYEIVRARAASGLSFPEFLRELRATHLAAPCPDRLPRRNAGESTAAAMPAAVGPDPLETAESARRIAEALAEYPADLRLAVQLFVIEGLPAADVARVVGWRDAKAVYNRVYRALATIRASLEASGIRRADL